MNTLQIASTLISIPSYVRGGTNEHAVARYMEQHLKRIPWLTVTRQPLGYGRYNIIARSKKGTPSLLIAGHMDTVEPKQASEGRAMRHGDRLTGLGSVDTKGGIASAISALHPTTPIYGLTMLFYCDEEYDFEGMRTFIGGLRKTQVPKFAIVLEPTDLGIWNAHRGLVELSYSHVGRSGHAARPSSGRNAIDGMMFVLADLKKYIASFSHRLLGDTTLNVAYMHGGLLLEKRKAGVQLGRQGNNIADYCETVVELRTTSEKIRAKDVERVLRSASRKHGFSPLDTSTRHDLGSLYTAPKQFVRFQEDVTKVVGRASIVDASKKGYSDGQLLHEATGVPVVYFGPTGKHAHAAGEWVSVRSLYKLRDVLVQTMKSYSSHS